MVVPYADIVPLHGMMFKYYCIYCCMSIPHFLCYPTVFPASDVTGIFRKSMAEKGDQQGNNNGQQWQPFQPAFNPRPPLEPHPFNYEQQHRIREPAPGEFDNDLARQQTRFVPNFFPRFDLTGISFPDFTDYQSFNGFQRNSFIPFGSQFINPSWNTFQLNPAPIPVMDTFNLSPHNQHQPLNNFLKPKDNITSSLTLPHAPISNGMDDKPPVLTAEYSIKHCIDPKIVNNSDILRNVKDEPLDASDHRKNVSFQPPPPLPIEKPYEIRTCNDPIPFSQPFYTAPPAEINTNPNFKQEVATTPPGTLHDCQVCLSTHANGLHFGARTCAACAAFFRRTVSDEKRYVCKRNQRCTNASRDGTGYRKICRACRMTRCMDIGMLPENVQHKRNRRESGNTPPSQKTPFDTFFTGFYPTFNPPSSAIPPIPPVQMPVDSAPIANGASEQRSQ